MKKIIGNMNTWRISQPIPWRTRTLPIPKIVNYKHLQQNKGIGPYELDYNQEHKKGHK